MWLKLPGPHMHPMSEEGGGLFVLPSCQGSEYMPGIYRARFSDGSPECLIRFAHREHAAESLSNMFLVWARNPGARYLIPKGNTWILDPAIKERPKEVA